MLIERTSTTYGPSITGASKSVLLEVMTILRAYQEALVLVGGWVPFLLLEHHQRRDDPFVHVGSIDIDLAVDPSRINEPQYATIVELLTERGYRPALSRRGERSPSSFERLVKAPLTKKPYTIRIDFLTPPGSSHHPREIALQDELFARKAKGCELAFQHVTTMTVSGTLPDGGELSIPLRMADIVACLAMKGIVLGERYREKDAYDLYAVIVHHDGGPQAVADLVRPYRDEPLVHEGLKAIRAAFSHRQAHGPAWVAAFLVHPMFDAEHQRVLTDAFMQVHEFCRHLDRDVVSHG